MSAWTGHVVVCGVHSDGVRIVEQLRQAGSTVVAVDAAPDAALLRLATGQEVPYLSGDSRVPATLEGAGIGGAAALICVEGDDLHNLATALVARALRPELRIVVGLRNAAVGRALADIGVSVVDVGKLSAPSVVEACLRTHSHELELGGESFLVTEVPCERAGTLGELYDDLAVLAIRPGGSRSVVVAPVPDREVVPGDIAVLVGRAAQIRSRGLGPRPLGEVATRFVGARAPRYSRPRPTALLRYLITSVDRRLTGVLLALGGLIVVSVTILLIGYREVDGRNMSPLDALYFTIETIGTVGFGDFYFRDQDPWLRGWAIALMVIGAGLVTLFFALLTNALISRTIAQSLGRRRVTGLSDHVVVVGLGSVGNAVVDGLRDAGSEVVVVDTDEENRFLATVRRQEIPVIIADATVPETFDMVRLAHARAVAVMTSDDLTNIEIGLAVRDLLGSRRLEVPVVLRVFDRQLADTVAASFDFRYVRSTAALAAPWFVGAALGLDVLGTFYVGSQPILVVSMPVGKATPVDGMKLGDVAATIMVASVRRADGTSAHLPSHETALAAGDVAYLIGPYEELLGMLGGR
ncbi:MAG TPA: NAD-binding protein [Microlunatus sp.]|nr:NAD-binding protein [Microlunatus sp.]